MDKGGFYIFIYFFWGAGWWVAMNDVVAMGNLNASKLVIMAFASYHTYIPSLHPMNCCSSFFSKPHTSSFQTTLNALTPSSPHPRRPRPLFHPLVSALRSSPFLVLQSPAGSWRCG